MRLSREEKEIWTLFEKVGFRFFFVYFSIYTFCLLGGGIFKPLVHWVAESVFNISYDFSEKGYGSGDTTYQYVLLFIIFISSFLGTGIWSILDKRKSYNQLNYALILLLRFVLIVTMFIYGFIKIFHMQMVPPVYTQLLRNLGDMSPMGLAWTFMGYSKLYIIFAGASEVIAGILLISRRLQTIASIVVVAVMTNVFMMNMSFDIPVKIFSFHLLLMGVYLFLTNSKRFVRSSILGKPVLQDLSYPIYDKEKQQIMRKIKATLTFLALLLIVSIGANRRVKFNEILSPQMKGAYEVIHFEKNGELQLPLVTDRTYWQYLLLEVDESASIIKLDQSYEAYSLKIDTTYNKLKLTRRSDSLKSTLRFIQKGNDTLILKGIHENDTLYLKTIRRTEKDFNLTNREFRWVNEKPNVQ